ncbi:MAG: hypothetical protein JOZ46_09495 [Candidatus Dormibacteraeota bacterium]|nr:hypothetical protein [Candidatus Dormibacteraeota bacterium]MBV9526029.1 hypothetical protein [Candidatus Dormibacteraeota bacterium]
MPEFARLSTFDVAAGRAEDAIAFFKRTDLPEAAEAAGFRRGFWLLDRETGKGAELVIFKDKAALDAAEAEEEDARSRASEAGVTMSAEQFFEVVAEGRPAAEPASVG